VVRNDSPFNPDEAPPLTTALYPPSLLRSSLPFAEAEGFEAWLLFLQVLSPLPFLALFPHYLPSVTLNHGPNWASSLLPFNCLPPGATQPRLPCRMVPHLKQNLGSLSYLKEIECFLSLIYKILPLEIGLVKSRSIQTRRYSPQLAPSSSNYISSTLPTYDLMRIPISLLMQARGRLNIRTQRATFSKSISAGGVSPSKSARETRSPSKVHGQPSIILDLSHSFSNSIIKVLLPTDLKETLPVGY
jgi:hypothetical protein